MFGFLGKFAMAAVQINKTGLYQMQNRFQIGISIATLSKIAYKFIPTFGNLTDLASY